MKKVIIIFSFFLLPLLNAFSIERPIELKEITQKIKQSNLYVLENAQKVYQVKEAIQLSRRNLLPRLNLWRLIDGVTNPRSLLGIVEDIAPFLVPNNWLRVKEDRYFSVATQHAYKALTANEILTARGLFVQASLEERLLECFKVYENELNTIKKMIESREKLGSIPYGSTLQFQVKQLELREEINTISRVVSENRSQLTFLLGITGSDEAVPTGLKYLDELTELSSPLKYDDYEKIILNNSNELKQYDSLIQVADIVAKGRVFNFLGGSSISRGAMGNVFDNLPQQDGLGFGLGPSIQIVRSQKNILIIQRTAITQTLKRNLKLLVDSFNLDLMARRDSIQRVQFGEQLFKNLKTKILLGEDVDLFEMQSTVRSKMESLSYYHAVETRLFLNMDRLKRLLMKDDYSL